MVRGEKPLWVPNQTLENNALQPLVMDDARARNFEEKTLVWHSNGSMSLYKSGYGEAGKTKAGDNY